LDSNETWVGPQIKSFIKGVIKISDTHCSVKKSIITEKGDSNIIIVIKKNYISKFILIHLFINKIKRVKLTFHGDFAVVYEKTGLGWTGSGRLVTNVDLRGKSFA